VAVYKKTYQRYDGALSPEWSRFLVIPRFAFEEMRQSRVLTIFYIVSLLVPLGYAVFIYGYHNLSALKLMQVDPAKLLPIDARFFLSYMGLQSMLSFLLTAFIGPGLVSPDLANNALPLYLSRPFTRTQYVIGKLSVLLILLSLMTWIPGLFLFGLQAYMGPPEWLAANWRVARALLVGCWVWILLLSLLALAISAWVKWKPVAGALMFGVFFVAAGFGAAINGVLRTHWGNLINIAAVIGTVWESLFSSGGDGAVFFRIGRQGVIPVSAAWMSLAAMCLLCLFILGRKIKGTEVVK
jgi:ABC-2 type transport system permease protein